jgi:hypothetical protein
MRRFAFALALPLLAGCTTMTPMASYVSVTDAGDVTGVVPAIAGYVSDTLPASSRVLIEPPASGGWDPVTPALIAKLHARGFAIADAQHPDGAHTISFTVSPLDTGLLVRIAIDGTDDASQFLARGKAGKLQPGGPYTVREASR